MHDGVTAASGMSQYIFNVDNVDQAPISAGASTNIIVQPTLYQIGTSGGSVIQAGRRFTLAGPAGVGIAGTSDGLLFYGWQLTGDFDVYAKLGSFIGPGNSYATAGLMWRDVTPITITSTPGARFGSMGQWLAAQQLGWDHLGRNVASENALASGLHQFTPLGVNALAWSHMRRRGSVFSYRYSADGSLFTSLIADTQTVSSALMVGAFVCDNQSPGATLTAAFDELRYTQSADISLPAITTGGTKVIKVKARDVNGTDTAYTATQSGAIGSAPASAIKHAPGFYAQGNFLLPIVSLAPAEYQSGGYVYEFIRTVVAQAGVTGGKYIVTHGCLEKDRLDYSSGFAIFNKIIELHNLLAGGKPAMIHIWDRKFGGTPGTVPQSSATRAFADWQISGGHVASSTYGAHWIKTWETTEMDMSIQLYQALGTAYNGSKVIQGFETAETSVEPALSGYTDPKFLASIMRAIDAIDPYWQNSGRYWCCNWFNIGDQASINCMRTLFAKLVAKKWGAGGPDMYTLIGAGNAVSHGEGVARGLGSQPAMAGYFGFTPDYGPDDYRGVIPLRYHMEYAHTRTKEVIYDYSRNGIRNTMLDWSVQAAGGTYQDGGALTAANAWPAVLAYVPAQPAPIVATACPSVYGDACSTTYGPNP